jgi:hypothetical protein
MRKCDRYIDRTHCIWATGAERYCESDKQQLAHNKGDNIWRRPGVATTKIISPDNGLISPHSVKSQDYCLPDNIKLELPEALNKTKV